MITITVPEFSNPFQVSWWLFTQGGFIVVIYAFLHGLFWLYLDYIQTKYIMNTKYMLLAIDVPRENEQTPKAVEHIFSHFHGLQKTPSWKEKYLRGYVQPTISAELVSIGGYIQFLIRCPEASRDLVESAIYAQYPNAEISEVEDYVNQFKAEFPNDKYDMWGAELTMLNKDVYPIRTYPLWEHSLTQTFLDPLASLLEVIGRIDSTEQIWMQWIIEPANNDSWRNKGIEIINKIAGIKSKKSGSALTRLVNAPAEIVVGTYETVTRTLIDPVTTTSNKKDDLPSLLLHLPPHVKTVIEAIGMKISKLGFKTKARVVYIAAIPQFNKARVSGIMGALKQYASMDMNGFKPDKKMKTAREWFFVDRRVAQLKRKILWGYKYRSIWRGRRTFVLNIEELASLWHFPVITVKAPQVKKIDAKRGEPPTTLPVSSEEEMAYEPKTTAPAVSPDAAVVPAGHGASTRGGPPVNLPIS